MSSLNVDEVLDKLSTKFNKIFYDREFVCCVNQDFQVVLENKNSCCVVVFPVLGPNYLKAVRYQAKIFDLAVITLSTGRTRAIAVCQKEFIKKNSNEVEEPPKVQIMPQSSNESSNTKLRKKRPERQLYVPPAQRRLPLSTEVIPYNNDRFSNIRNAEVLNRKSENSKSSNKNVSKAHEKSHCKLRKRNSLEAKGIDKKSVQVELENKGTSRDIASGSETPICLHYLSSIHFYILWHYRVDVNYFLTQEPLFRFYNYNFYTQLPLYSSRSQLNTLYILRNNSLLWQPKLNVLATNDAVSSDTSRTYPSFNFEQPLLAQDYEFQQKAIVLIGYGNHLEATYESISKDFDYSEYKAFKILWSKSQCVSVDDVIVDLSVVNSGHSFIISDENGGDYFYECTEDHNIFTCYLDKKKDLHNRKDNCSKNNNNLPQNQNETWLLKSSVIVLEDRPILEKSSDKTTLTVKKNNNKNTSTNGNVTRSDLINNVTNNIKAPKESNEHDQEKEIMRKTKEHINRKSRPIMKYVDDTADTLKIGKNDNVNNWEELFDDDGQLQEELFKEVVQKVGTDVTILKAKEDYSDYVTKQSEELEHMVELYDFPPTLETHDIIQAFSAINSEAMYIKWVDDTHAILVLGSLKQAQRAVELDNPLIKARPMSVASGVSLATAYKHDLKPAMKRPPTNLQTARRLITTHLGTKSRISKEQNAKERNDLKAARELKKLTRKNEQDAWEGTLRSAIN